MLVDMMGVMKSEQGLKSKGESEDDLFMGRLYAPSRIRWSVRSRGCFSERQGGDFGEI